MTRNEKTVVELPFLETCKAVGYYFLDGQLLTPDLSKERKSMKEVILQETLKSSLIRINPEISQEQIKEILDILNLKGVYSSLFEANKQIYEYLTKGIKLTIDTPAGKKDKNFFLISEDSSKNTYNVVTQLKIQGSKENIIPDVLIYINGIPVGVVECKYSGTEKTPISAGLHQLKVYTEKVPSLFYYNQFLISTCLTKAMVGSLTGFDLYFNEWKDTYPHNKPVMNSQDTLIWGMLHPTTLTDIIFNHVNYEGDKKQIPRYQQYRAVKKAIKVLSKNSESRLDRSGIIYHTQRSGKTLTMVNLAKALHKEFQDYKIVFLVDRTDLETQHLDTFNKVFNRPIKVIESSDSLQEELKKDSSNVVFGMIHKFREDEVFPELNKSDKILVIVDEAHRSQYKTLGANLNKALPNAAKIGFTGTPLFKNDTTTKEFGSIIDSYTRSEAVADGCTVPLKYENRIPNIFAEFAKMEIQEAMVLKNLDTKTKDKAIREFVNKKTIFNSDAVIDVITLDMMNHYQSAVEPEGFKAMFVAEDKETAVKYFNRINFYNGPKATVVISGDHNDPEHIKKFTDEKVHDEVINNFKDPKGDIKILIVVAKLLTGFNAPICQVVYFAKQLKEHSLAQAIDRPVTPFQGKEFGLIVDYCGMKENLEETVRMFDRPQDKENVFQDIQEDLSFVKATFENFSKKASKIDLKKFEDSFLLFEDEDSREDLLNSFKKVSKAINGLLPSPEVLPYVYKLKPYEKFIKELKEFYQEEILGLADIGAKITKLLNENIKAELSSDRLEPLDILSSNFLTRSKKRNKIEVQKAEAEYAIKKYIKEHRATDPIYFDKIAAKLKEVIEKYRENAAEQLAQFLKLREEILQQENYAKAIDLTREQLPAFHSVQDFLGKNTKLSIENQVTAKNDIVPKLKNILNLIIERKNQTEGLTKETNINEIKNYVVDVMGDFWDESVEYSLYSDRASLLASELIDRHR